MAILSILQIYYQLEWDEDNFLRARATIIRKQICEIMHFNGGNTSCILGNVQKVIC